MTKDVSMLWVEKYRPTTLDTYIFQNKGDLNLIGQMVLDQNIPHLLLSGVQGSGKTTLAKVLVNELDMHSSDVMVINASDETGVDNLRTKLKAFVQTYAMGKYKIVNLEEADYLSHNAQATLRHIMEEYHENVRFILTCNYDYKIITPLKSRLHQFKFSTFPVEDIVERIEYILTQEGVSYDKSIVEDYVSVAYPDIRKTINLVQQHTHNNKLQKPTQADEFGDYKFKLLDLVETGDWMAIRDLLCGNIPNEEWDDIYKFLYTNLEKSSKFGTHDKWANGLVVINDHMAKHSSVAIPDVNFTACMIQLSKL